MKVKQVLSMTNLHGTITTSVIMIPTETVLIEEIGVGENDKREKHVKHMIFMTKEINMVFMVKQTVALHFTSPLGEVVVSEKVGHQKNTRK